MRAEPRGGERVAVPLIGHADARPAHADDVRLVLVVALNAHAGKNQRAFLVNVQRFGEVARRNAVADVGHMAFGDGREQMLVIDEHRHQKCVVGRMGVAAIRIVVEISIAFANVARVIARQVLALQVGAEDMHRQPFGRGEELIVAGEDAAGEIARARNHRRARRAQKRIGHFAHDAVEPVGDDGHHHRVEHIGFACRLAACRLRYKLRLGGGLGLGFRRGLCCRFPLGFELGFLLGHDVARL